MRLPTLSQKVTHLVNTADDVARHVLKSLLHLLQQVLHKLVKFLCGWILRSFKRLISHDFKLIIDCYELLQLSSPL